MGENDEFAFPSGERDVHELGRALVSNTPAKHGSREVTRHGGIKNDDVTLTTLEAMDGPDFDVIGEPRFLDQLLDQPYLMAIGGNDADGWGRMRMLLQGLRCQPDREFCMSSVTGRTFVVLVDPTGLIARVHEG